jgi:hypothetical protein
MMEPTLKTKHKPNVIFDFDGVINRYDSGWQGPTLTPDPPVEGIREAILEVAEEFRVVVVSSRCYHEGGIEAIKAYMTLHDIYYDDVTGEKPHAVVQIDDRAITFDGNPKTLLEKIKTFKTWYQK